MAFSTETNRADYDGNDVATSFPLPFPWQLDEDIKVIATDKTVTPNVEHNLVLDVDYSLTGVGESSGTLTFPKAGSTYSTLATGWSITALRVPAFTQETDFQFGDGVEPEPLEAALDRNAMGLGALQEQVNRCLTLPESYSGDPLAVPLPVASSVLTWNAAGDALENGPTTTQISSAQGYAVAAQAAQGLAEDARDAALGYSDAASDSADAAGVSESACAGYQAAVQAEGTTQVNRVISEGDTQVDLCEDQVALAAEYATKAEDSAITGHPTDYSAYHWSKKAEAAATGGTVKVSADDTTPGYLESKLAVASNGGLTLATTSPAGNEVRTVGVKVKASSGLNLDTDGLWVDLGTDPALEFSADGLEVKVKSGGGITKDADGLSISASGLPAGSVIGVASETVPTGYLECDGAAVSRTTYSDLFTAIGVFHGYGDNSTTFNLPDYRGRFLRGWDHAVARDPDRASRTAMATGGQTGDHVGSVQAAAFASHTHSAAIMGAAGMFGTDATYTAIGTSTTSATGGNETRPINAGVMYCIKY